MANTDLAIVQKFKSKPLWGGQKQCFFTGTITNTTGNYTTGGYLCDLTKFGLGTLRFVKLPPMVNVSGSGFVPYYDATNKKLQFFITAGSAPLTEYTSAGAGLNNASFQFSAEGTGA